LPDCPPSGCGPGYGIINSGQMQWQEKSGVAERNVRVEQKKREEQIKKNIPFLGLRQLSHHLNVSHHLMKCGKPNVANTVKA